MLTGWKVSFLASKSVFYRPEHIAKRRGMELNFEDLEKQKWNMPTVRTQRVGEKNGVVCLVIMFTSGLMVLKKSRMANFLYFLPTTAKNQSQFGQNI